MRTGKLEVDFGYDHVWITCILDPNKINMTVKEEWKVGCKAAIDKWDTVKGDILQDVGRRLQRAEEAVLN